MKRDTFSLIALSLILAAPCFAASNTREVKRTCQLKRDYYLYLPKTLDKNRTYRLVVAVHGYGGRPRGALGMAGWAERGDCIVVAPQFPNQGYQYLYKQAGEQLVQIFEDLQKEIKLYPKMFLWGHSGGGQYTHRFALKYPNLVAGCSSHAAGTWLTGDYPPANQDVKPSPKANSVIFAIHCGMKDTGKSFSQCPMGRMDWAKKFAGVLYDKGFVYKEFYHPDIGHGVSAKARSLTTECYYLSTMGMDVNEGEKVIQAETVIRKAIVAKKTSTVKRGIAALRKLAAAKVKSLPKETKKTNAPKRTGKVKRDASGWYFSEAQSAQRTKRRADYLTNLADSLEAQLTGKPVAKPVAPAPKPAPPVAKPVEPKPEEKPNPEPQPAAKFCTKCGTKSTGNTFCTKCGKKR